MNRSFQPTSPLQRLIFAAVAVLTMLATAGGIDGLIAHYGTDAPLASAQAQPIGAALRATDDAFRGLRPRLRFGPLRIRAEGPLRGS